MKKFILAIDQGTTGTTSLLMDAQSFEFVNKVNKEFTQIFPKPGYVEHDLNEIWSTVEFTISEVIKKSKITPEQIISIGITNQRETTCAFSKDGKPHANAIVWQDRRTANYCDDKREKYKDLQKKTGLPLDPYFSGTKMNYLLTNNKNVQEAEKKNDLLFSTIDTFLLYKLSSGESFKTEPSNASRTLLMDLKSCQWDNELLNFFEIPKDSLPEISESFSNFGRTNKLSFLPDGIPITCLLGDQQAALFGQAGFNKGDLKCTYGTGAFILLNTGNNIQYSENGLLTTVAFKHKDKAVYALEGSSYIAGAAVQWLRDNLDFFPESPEIEKMALKATEEEMEHIQFYPFFTGIGSPYWNSQAKAALVGLTRDSGKPQIARATLEGITLSINDSIEALSKDAKLKIKEIRVDGGACQNDFLMQIQANFSEAQITRPQIIETTAYGAALGALIGDGSLDFEKILDLWKEEKVFKSEPNKYYSHKKELWKKNINRFF